MEVEINGKKIGLLFGYFAYKSFCISWYESPDQFLSTEGELTRYAVAQIVFLAYENWRTDLRRTRELSFDDCYEWVDNAALTDEGLSTLSLITEEWAKSKHVKRLISDMEKKSQPQQTELTLTKLNQSVSESLE